MKLVVLNIRVYVIQQTTRKGDGKKKKREIERGGYLYSNICLLKFEISSNFRGIMKQREEREKDYKERVRL